MGRVEDELAAEWNRRVHDAAETAALQKVRDEMAEIRDSDEEYVDRWLAALDAILEQRK